MILYDQDGPDIVELSHKTRVARKQHICCVCKEVINIGDKYECHAAVYDGKFLYERMHFGAHNYPSLCPKFYDHDLADMNRDYYP